MVEYAIITNHTNYGMDLIKSDPNIAFDLASETDTKVRNATNGNYGISSIYIDFEGKMTYYDLEPLSISAKEDMRLLSLGMPSVGVWDYIKKIISVVLAVAAFIIGALVGGWGLLAGTIIAGSILLWSYSTNKIEYEQNALETNQEYARQYADGEINWDEYQEFASRKEKVMEESKEISWKMIIIGGLVGAGVLGALYIFMSKRK